MEEIKNKKPYDLSERTFIFARDVMAFIKLLPRNVANVETAKQLVRSAGSVGANYIEGNEALGKKDFILRMRICRKESKESRYWLRLVETKDKDSDVARQRLADEATELMKIFNAIIEKKK